MTVLQKSKCLLNCNIQRVFEKKVMSCGCTDVEVDVDELNQEQVLDVNKMATTYGMAEGDFVR